MQTAGIFSYQSKIFFEGEGEEKKLHTQVSFQS